MLASILTFAFLLLGADTIEGIGPIGKIEKVQGGFGFTEGPAVDKAGNLYFSDIPNEKIHKVEDGKVSVFIEKSNHANGLMFDGKGRLVACEMDGQIVAHSPD